MPIIYASIYLSNLSSVYTYPLDTYLRTYLPFIRSTLQSEGTALELDGTGPYPDV